MTRNLGKQTVSDIGTPKEPVRLINGHVGFRKDGFWYTLVPGASWPMGYTKITNLSFQDQLDQTVAH